MKRKLLIAATSFMIASSVCGKDFNVLTKDFQPWGNTQFDMEGMKITWTQKWQGGGWGVGPGCSGYDIKNPHGLSFGRFCPWMSCS